MCKHYGLLDTFISFRINEVSVCLFLIFYFLLIIFSHFGPLARKMEQDQAGDLQGGGGACLSGGHAQHGYP